MKYIKEFVVIIISAVISFLIGFGFYVEISKRIVVEKCFIWAQLQEQQTVSEFISNCKRAESLLR